LIGGGLVLLLAAVPVALIGASELLADALSLSHRGWAYLIVSAVVAVLTVVLALIGLPRLLRSFESLNHSKDELSRNVAWIKTVLANSGRAPAHRRR
jgi:putative exporter of polyketide antibiotics